MATRRRNSELPPPSAPDLDDLDGVPDRPDPVGRQTNRKTDELQSQMAARNSGKPIFPYPPELDAKYRPYWLELVNSFPKDHFQVSDITLMKMYCRAAYDVERITLLIEEEGEVVMGGRGPTVNPRVKVRTDAQSTMFVLATKFRNQPASRVNSENFQNRQGKTVKAGNAAQAVEDDDDGLLAGKMH